MGSTVAIAATMLALDTAQSLQQSKAAEKQAKIEARTRDGELRAQQERLRLDAEQRRRQAGLRERQDRANEAELARRHDDEAADRQDRLRRAMAAERARTAASGTGGAGGSGGAILRRLLSESGETEERAGLDLAARLAEARTGRDSRMAALSAAEAADDLDRRTLAGRRRANLLELAATRRQERMNRIFSIGRSALSAGSRYGRP